MPIPVQVAFQGGGAKLVNLLAAAQALEEAHQEGTISIRRVAGTSAGSIAACLLASGTGIANARQSLRTPELFAIADSLSAFNKWRALWRACNGNSIHSLQPILDWLDARLRGKSPNSIRRTIEGVTAMRPDGQQIELLIVSSDLANRGSKLAPASDSVMAAIADSCGIPFVFKTYHDQDVDGGLCANLPVDFLRDQKHEDSEVLAISFAAQPIPGLAESKTLLGFLLAITDTAIAAGEQKARDSLPEANVFSIATDLNTFDFSTAMRAGLGEQYERILRDARDWLASYVSIREKRALTLPLDPWRDSSEATVHVMTELGRYFEQLEEERYIHCHRARLLVVANSLRTPDDIVSGSKDAIELQIEFSIEDQAVHMLGMTVTQMHPESVLDLATLFCTVTSGEAETVRATLIPMHRPSSRADRRVCVCFAPPLPPRSGPYKLHYGLRGTNFMRPLQLGKADSVSYFPTRTRAPVSRMELILQVPEGFKLEVSQRGKASNPRALVPDEMPRGESYGLRSYGFRADNVEKTEDLWQMEVKVPD